MFTFGAIKKRLWRPVPSVGLRCQLTDDSFPVVDEQIVTLEAVRFLVGS